MLKAIRKRLAEFQTLSKQEEHRISPRVNQHKIRMAEIDKEIDDLLSKVGSANAILMEYINNKVEALDGERRRLQEEILSLTHQPDSNSMNVITNHVKAWDEATFKDKQAVVDALIKVITIADGNIEITWNI